MKIQDLIIFEADDFIVLNKPSGLLSIRDREGKEPSLKDLLLTNHPAIFTVHRLDRGTSGLIVFAKNEDAHSYLSRQFARLSSVEGSQQAEKIYLGLIVGSPIANKGTIDSPIMEHPSKKGVMTVSRKGKDATTDYEVVENFGMYSWVQFQIHTGRTHQIRVHMKELGHPIVCDDLYGDGKPVFVSDIKHNFKLSMKEESEKPILNRLALHAFKLAFTGPDGTLHQFECPIPKDLKATLQQLSKGRSRHVK